MQLSQKARRLLLELLQSKTWAMRRAPDLARWRQFAQQLFADGIRQFDAEQLRGVVYEQLGGRKHLSGRVQDEVELRIRLAAAVFDFSLREGRSHAQTLFSPRESQAPQDCCSCRPRSAGSARL